MEETGIKLNLGCCDRHAAGFVNVDIQPPADEIADLTKIWPWPDSSVERIVADDIVEHLPDKRHTMNEAWRVLKRGGTFEIDVPTTAGYGAWQDPTHVSFWTPNDFFYYEDGNAHRERFGKRQGVIARFKVVKFDHRLLADNVWKLKVVLEAVK